jgi:hypothetical protein
VLDVAAQLNMARLSFVTRQANSDAE